MSTTIRLGDIREIRPLLGLDAPTRLGVVCNISDRDRGYAEVMLIREGDVRLTSGDAVLTPAEPLFTHPIVVQSRLRGPVWNRQIRRYRATLSGDERNLIADVAVAQLQAIIDGEDVPTELALSEADTLLLQSELDALMKLTGDRAHTLLDDGSSWRIDAGVVSPALLARVHNSDVIISDLMHILRTRRVVATHEDLEEMFAQGAFDPAAWANVPGMKLVANDIVIGLRTLADSAILRPRASTITGHVGLVSVFSEERLELAPRVLPRALDRLVSASFLWRNGGEAVLKAVKLADGEADGGYEITMLAMPEQRSESDDKNPYVS